jgi:diaminopimelate epimerase
LISASKYHAYGNDFLILLGASCERGRESEVSRAICDPHFGVGADGCVFLEPREGLPFGFRIFNQDGSEAGMSGNGLRCAASFLHHKEIVASEEVYFDTAAGPRSVRLIESTYPVWTFRAAMGQPEFSPAAIPMRVGSERDRVTDYAMRLGDRVVSVTAMSVGNPQCVVFTDEPVTDEDFETLGRGLAMHPDFPEGTNVSFVEVLDRSVVGVRIWERGVGPTHSSGTGCCGAAVAALMTGRVEDPIQVRTETGTQLVEWEDGKEILLTGQASFIADVRFEWAARL